MAILLLAQHLKALRDFYKYTQEYVSSKLNIERPTYSNYELGKRTPTLELIVALAEFYNVTLDDLLINPDFTPSASKAENELTHSECREQELLSIYRTLPDPEQQEFLEYARFKKNRYNL